MTKRARFDGPDEEIAVYDGEASVYDPPIDVVKRGALLSTEVPARIRDELLARDNWTEVKQPESKTEEKA